MSWFKRFNFFQSVAVGLDIADRSIEVAELTRRRGRIQVAALGRQVLPPGVVERGLIKDTAKLTSIVRSVLSLAQPQAIMPHRIHFGLPENQVYLHSFSLPQAEGARVIEKELQALAAKEAEENIPISADDLLVTYELIDGGPLCLIAAVNRHVLRDWQTFFRSLGFEVEFDLETLALFRSLGLKAALPVAVVDFGTVATNVAVFDHRGLRYSRTLAYGTEALTDSLVKNLKITAAAAEKQKLDVGLMDPESKIFTVLLKDLVPLRDELKITFDYYERTANKKIEAIYLAGGGSQLRGLADYLKSNLEITTMLARSIFLNQPLVYLEALGLALKGFGQKHSALDFKLNRTDANLSASGWLKQNSKWLIFIAIMLVGGLALWGADRYRQAVEQARQEAIQAQIDALPVISPEVILPSATTTEETSTTTEIKTVTVTETPTGWLNVRAGAGTNFSVVAKVYPGEDYPLLAEKGEWYKIELGWVSKQYIIKN